MNRPAAKISVIIPVYNGERYLKQTIDSVLWQTFRDIEIICVNDGSTDGSLKILEDYARQDARIIVYSKPNGGLPAISLNYGLDRSRGKYVFPLGHDDYLREDTMHNLYNRAVSTAADVVIPDLLIFHEDDVIIRSIVGLQGDRSAVLTNREAVIASLDWTIHAFALWNGDLVRRIRYDESGMNSDEYSAREFFLNSNRIVFSEGAYYYRQHGKSVTKRISLKRYDVLHTNRLLLNLVQNNQFEDKIVRRMRTRELEGIVGCCINLARERKELSPVDRKSAERIIKNAYKSLDKRGLLSALVQEGGLKSYVKLLAFLPSYQLLRATCAGIRIRACVRDRGSR